MGLLAVLFLVRPDDVLRFQLGPRFGKVVVQELLEFRKLAVVVLNDLGRQVVEDVLLESPKEERQDLLVQCLERQSS